MTKTDILVAEAPLNVEACRSFVNDAGAGGQVVFIGTVRNQTRGKQVIRLEFEAYEPMATQELTKIANNISGRWKTIAISIHHRLGILDIGEIAVVIAVSTPHRDKAFAACQYAIDTLKETVPIWKKEIFEDGEIWVAAHP